MAQRSKPAGAARSKKRKTTTRRGGGGGRSAGRSGSGRGAKVGSDRASARKVGGKRDFGVPSEKPAAQRGASRRIREQHPGDRRESAEVQPRAGVDSREAGVGGREGGAGSFSGGDIDTDVTGVGAGERGLAQTGPDRPDEIGRAETTGGSAEFASGPPARGEKASTRGARRGSGGGGGSTASPMGSEDATTAENAEGGVGFTQATGGGGGGGGENRSERRGDTRRRNG